MQPLTSGWRRGLLAVLLLIGVTLGIAVDRLWLDGDSKASANASAGESALEHAGRHLEPNYVCPMHPDIRSTEPGECPICGMDLVQRTSVPADDESTEDGTAVEENATDEATVDEGTIDADVIQISAPVRHSFGVRIRPAERRTLERRLRAPGYLQTVKGGKPTRIDAPSAGRVQLEPGVQAGMQVKAGEKLATVTEEGKPPKPVTAPADGHILRVVVADGAAVETLAPIAFLQLPWRALVVANVFQSDISWVQSGTKAELILPNALDQRWPGTVTLPMVRVGETTNIVATELGFDVPPNAVRHGMLLKVDILGEVLNDRLTVPDDALIRTHEGTRVIKALGDGHFEPTPVEVGMIAGGYAEIISGLKDGEKVVVSAQFLIDAESDLSAELRRLGSQG